MVYNGGELKSAIIRFLRVFGAAGLSFGISWLTGLNQTEEIVLMTAFLVAADKYFRAKGWYDVAVRTVGLSK